MKTVVSRILEYFPKDLLRKMDKVRKSATFRSNNDKIKKVLQLLNEYGVDFIKIGAGTNRLAVLIDNYVFKIAMDDEGVRDNKNEFIVSPELQPYVPKTYECNGLICVAEYMTLISLEEFTGKSQEILEILENLSKRFLFGDIGYIKKNFQNWGYRQDGQLVALDFAYMYHIYGHMLTCPDCKGTIYYDKNYSMLVCPNCGKKMEFWDVRKRIDMNRIDGIISERLEEAITIDKPVFEIEDHVYDDNICYTSEIIEGEPSMYTKEGRVLAMSKLKKAMSYISEDTDPWNEGSYGYGTFSSYENIEAAANGGVSYDVEFDGDEFVRGLEEHKSPAEWFRDRMNGDTEDDYTEDYSDFDETVMAHDSEQSNTVVYNYDTAIVGAIIKYIETGIETNSLLSLGLEEMDYFRDIRNKLVSAISDCDCQHDKKVGADDGVPKDKTELGPCDNCDGSNEKTESETDITLVLASVVESAVEDSSVKDSSVDEIILVESKDEGSSITFIPADTGDGSPEEAEKPKRQRKSYF